MHAFFHFNLNFVQGQSIIKGRDTAIEYVVFGFNVGSELFYESEILENENSIHAPEVASRILCSSGV